MTSPFKYRCAKCLLPFTNDMRLLGHCPGCLGLVVSHEHAVAADKLAKMEGRADLRVLDDIKTTRVAAVAAEATLWMQTPIAALAQAKSFMFDDEYPNHPQYDGHDD